MRGLVLTLLFFDAFITGFGQPPKFFQIKQTFVSDSAQWKTPQDFTRQYNSFFEDSNYVVRKTCSGQWGGSVWFKSKKTGIEYACEATCPVAVNKLNGKYIVTCTLAHMFGMTTVFQIDDPSKMAVFKAPRPFKKEGKNSMYHVGDFESRSKKGCVSLLDTAGILTTASFESQGQLYYIFTDYKRTYAGTIKAGRFLVTDTVAYIPLWSYDPEGFITENGHYITFLTSQDVMGYLDIYDDKIHLIRYK